MVSYMVKVGVACYQSGSGLVWEVSVEVRWYKLVGRGQPVHLHGNSPLHASALSLSHGVHN